MTNENIYLLKLYLKRIILIDTVLKEYTDITDVELVKKLQTFIKLYLYELYKIKNKSWCLL